MTASVITATALASALLVASPFSVEASEPTPIEACTNISKLAEATMQHRQRGTAMADILNSIDTSFEYGVSIVRDAYSAPRFSTAKHQQREITEFANEWFGKCLDDMGR